VHDIIGAWPARSRPSTAAFRTHPAVGGGWHQWRLGRREIAEPFRKGRLKPE